MTDESETKTGYKINKLYAVISTDKDGDEGICAINSDGVEYQCVTSKIEIALEMMLLIADDINSPENRDIKFGIRTFVAKGK